MRFQANGPNEQGVMTFTVTDADEIKWAAAATVTTHPDLGATFVRAQTEYQHAKARRLFPDLP